MESKTVVFGILLCLLAILLLISATLAAAIAGVEVLYVDNILDFFKTVYLTIAGKNAIDNNAAPIVAAYKSGKTDAPPISKWGQPSEVAPDPYAPPSQPGEGETL